MMVKSINKIFIEHAHILFRNFSGKEGQYNRPGERNFCVIIEDDAYAEKLSDEGWNIKELVSRDPDEPPRHYMKVSVSYKNFPPKVYIITRHCKRLLSEDTVGELDFAEINNVDMTISPYVWIRQQGTKNEKSGIKAYLKSMYVTIEEDPFADKYADEVFSDATDNDDLPF